MNQQTLTILAFFLTITVATVGIVSAFIVWRDRSRVVLCVSTSAIALLFSVGYGYILAGEDTVLGVQVGDTGLRYLVVLVFLDLLFMLSRSVWDYKVIRSLEEPL